MKKSTKIKLIIAAVILLAVAGYVTYMCVNYFFYDAYKKYLTSNTYEEGTEFKALTDSDPKVDGMVLVAENDKLKLYTNTTTTEVAIYDKRSGVITYSNPKDRENDTIATGRGKVDLNSQFMLSYYDTTMTLATMYNYDYSVERNQFKMESIKDGIRFTYMCGNMDSPTGLVPVFIKPERLQEKVLSKLSEKDAKKITNFYMDSVTLPGFKELGGGTISNKILLKNMQKLFEQAGYTKEDFDYETAAAAGGNMPERTSFTIPLEYRLVDDKLVVSIPTDHIVETGTGRLADIDLLSYFGAGGMNESGYILVPNGSGSLIHFNNGKTTETYTQYIYGMDEEMQSYTIVDNQEKARLPIFGIKHADSAVFAEITSGDTLAHLIAGVSGNINSYNYVYPSFLIRGSDIASMFGVDGTGADLPTLEKNIYKVNLTVAYSFLTKDDASYSGMANYYRNELQKRGDMAQKQEEQSIPFYLDILGGVKKQQSILGVPYLSVYPMTTFDEAGTIVDKFEENNVTNLRVNYLGWFGGGYYHDAPKKVKVESKLGGKKDLKALNKKITDTGSRLYGDVAFQKVSFEAKYFNYKMESSMYYTGYPLFFGRVNPANLRQTSSLGYGESMYDILSPKFLVNHVGKFIKAEQKVDISGISLRDLGDSLPSDQKRTEIINREQAKQIVLGQFDRLDSSVGNLMVSGGNSYTWKYADDLENVPASDNPFYLVDEEVPFYQMVIHGCIDYTSDAINLTDSYNKQEILLRMIEFGEAPHFTFTYKDSSEIKYSALNVMYSTQYQTWLDDAVDIYQQTNTVLSKVVNSTVKEHETLSAGVKKITYDNGIVIYINYNNTDVTAEDVTVPAMSYVLKGGE